MEYLLLVIARARMDIPPDVLRWALGAATPQYRSWTELLGRSDVTDEQAWALLWRDGKLERSAEKVPSGAKGFWTSNATSERLAGHVASYLARPKVPSGRVEGIRERLDGTALTRLDLLREVTHLGGSDIVCHELAAEPPVGSSRGPRLGPRELALVERYRSNARNEAHESAETIASQVSAILAEDALLARVECARSQGAFGIEVLEACLFGHGSVAPQPESADAPSAEWLEEVSGRVMTYSPDSFRMGRIVSALRPIVRMHRDPAEWSAQRWWPRRIRDFGPAGAVPLTFSIPSEEGEYIIRKLGNDVRRYENLAALTEEQPDTPLGELCCATGQLNGAPESVRPDNGVGVEDLLNTMGAPPQPAVPGLDEIRQSWTEVSQRVRERMRTVGVMLSGATVHQAVGRRVVLAHASEPLAKRLNVSRNSLVVVDALRAVFGMDFEVTCIHLPLPEDETNALRPFDSPREAAGAAIHPALSAESVRAAWPEVCAQVRRRSRTVEIMLTRATVHNVDGNRVVLTVDPAPLCMRLAQSRNSRVVAEALHEVFGTDFEIIVADDPTAAR